MTIGLRAEDQAKPVKSTNLTWDAAALTPEERTAHLGRTGATVWMVGLSGSGKSTLARKLERKLVEQGRPAFRLDGDNVRHGLCEDLGFSSEDRSENLRRLAHVAQLLAESGQVAIVAAISPQAQHRAVARRVHAEAGLRFVEVFVDAPLEVCEQRDPKGLYAKARAGQISGFTGIDAPFEAPEHPELHLRTHTISAAEGLAQLMVALGAASG